MLRWRRVRTGSRYVRPAMPTKRRRATDYVLYPFYTLLGAREESMPCTDATLGCAVYRPRNPRASPLYRCVQDQAEELGEVGHIHRCVEDETLGRFPDCGDLHKGFARVYCDQCGHEYLLPFSCKTRCYCPSCHHNFAWSEIGRRQAHAVWAPRMVRIKRGC